MAVFVLETEFDVTRRVGWDETEDLATHMDGVIEVLRQSNDVRGVVADANLDTGRVSLEVTFDSWEPNRNEHARVVLGVAIRSAGGQHLGLLPEAEASGMNVEKEGWSPLRGAMWRCRKAVLKSNDGAGAQ